MDNKTVWITGASSGIGAALARNYAHRGSRVAVSARRETKLKSLIDSLPDSGRHVALPLDVSDLRAVMDTAENLFEITGPPDLLIANAGVGQRDVVLNTDPGVERRIMDVNFFGATNVTHAVLPAMLERGHGRIVVVSSVLGKVSIPGRTTYAASKHALQGYFEGLRAELHGTGVGITIIVPGYVRTEISIQSLRGTGQTHDEMDRQHRNAMSPRTFARKAVRAIERGKAEATIGGPETLAVHLHRLFPGLYRALLPHIIGSDD